MTFTRAPVLEIPDEGQDCFDLALCDELGSRVVAIVGDRFVAIPVDRLVDVAGELRRGRDHLYHLAHPALQAFR